MNEQKKVQKKVTKPIAKALMPLLACHHRRWMDVLQYCGLATAKRYQAAGLIELVLAAGFDGVPVMRLTRDGRAALNEYAKTHAAS